MAGTTETLNWAWKFFPIPGIFVGDETNQGESGVELAVRKDPKAPEFTNGIVAALEEESPSVIVTE